LTLPNGDQEESPRARSVLRLLVECPEIQQAYVSGCDKNMIQKAITQYDLPFPIMPSPWYFIIAIQTASRKDFLIFPMLFCVNLILV
jgi:hypothetical protein